ncbi:MAG: glyoxalase-like domain protein [Candidatus Saccharibacteria bacterium]|nr:glyoxalase-like domain protein [Candidatus Saccharibacteria bacterium]
MAVRGMYLNIATKDLDRAKRFFMALGFDINPKFSDDTAASIEFGSGFVAMLLTEPKMKQFTTRQIADNKTTIEYLMSLQLDSRHEVESLFRRVLSAGGTETRPAEDFGWMYLRSFYDLDGHAWEIFYIDEGASNPAFGNS